MRIYEFAKLHNVPAKDLIDALQIAGFPAKSHMATITDEAVIFLEKKFLKSSKITAKTEETHSIPLEVLKKDKTEAEKKTKQPMQISKVSDATIAQEKKQDIGVQEEFVITAASVAVIAEKFKKSMNDVILTLLKWGIITTKNQVLSEGIVRRLADHYQIKAVNPVVGAEAISKKVVGAESTNLKERLPIVVVLGHVDHGKTTLLDFIRKTRVASREKGGITQHIGAYEATTPQGKIIFLDTPGHEAFPKMRQRGVRVADIVILVIAADDGIMPQTIEAIKQAKSMAVPIIVAINKIDKANPARIDVVKRELAQQDLLPEDWGGQVVCVPISAKLGTGVDQLLEMVALQAELMDLRADFSGPAKGFVLESKVEKGYGPVATVINQQGKVKIGDFFVCGNTVGKATSIVDSYGKRIQEVGPTIPVQISGFENLAQAGDFFKVVSKEEYLAQRNYRTDSNDLTAIAGKFHKEGSINLIVKTDTNSSKEALLDAINRLSKKSDHGFYVLQSSVGGVSESDVELAFNTGADIIGLHVKVESNAALLAQHHGVTIKQYDVIYKLLETLEERGKKPVEVQMVRTKIGEANVLRVFDIKGVGIVAGSYVKTGRFVGSGGTAVISRGGQKVAEGKIISLQRDKKSVKEVHAGYECGFVVEGVTDWLPDDKVECFIDMPKK